MNRNGTIQKGDSGMALLTATIFIAVALLTVSALCQRYLQQRLNADAYQNYNKTFDALEAAMAFSKAQLESSAANGIIGLEGWTPEYNDRNDLVLPAFDGSVGHPAAMPADPGDTACPPPEFLAFSVDWGADNRDNNGDGVVNDGGERGMFSIHVAAKFRNVTRRAEGVYRATNVNVWQNAIFAGAGSTADVIKGNVSIYGSVHILGDNLLVGGIAIEDAIDLSGTSIIRNNYDNLPAYLRVRIPALPLVNLNGTMAQTLEAKLRVKHGLVGMSGNSQIGQPYTGGSPVKQMMDGTYVTDGWGGKKATPDGGRGIPSDVFSDNGWSELYDLSDKVKFPLLSDPWRDPATGAMVNRLASVTPYTHEEYFTEVLLANPSNPSDGIYSGNMVLDAGSGSALYWNATTNTKLTGAAALSASPGVNDDYVKFDPAMDTLRMNGQIKINGDLSFSGSRVNYSGRCAFLTTGDVNINASLLTCNNGASANYADSFPAGNCLGIMTSKNMNLGTGSGASQLDIMGAFYAQQTITSAKQTNVLGTFVSASFNISKNVPNIYQVPELANSLPEGMIGANAIMVIRLVSWRELGLG
jgi:phage baseplate assembly protein gpV